MNHVDNKTQRHALARQLLAAGSSQALAEYLAEIVLAPALLGGENTACMHHRGRAVIARIAALEAATRTRRRRRQPRTRAWRAAEAALFTPN